MNLEGELHLPKDLVEIARLQPARGLNHVAMHRIADPQNASSRTAHGLDERGELLLHLRGTHPGDKDDLARRVVGVEDADQLNDLLRARARTELYPHRI